jgi:MurNAc alpha-1-phosphate uridylyltransferase
VTQICAVLLAAGEGRRLRPLTEDVPKALCPVGNVPAIEPLLARLARLGFDSPGTLAVNACYLGQLVVAAVAGRAHLSVEPGPTPLGTAGGVARLRNWIDGRGVLVGNADAYLSGGDLATLLDGWDGERTRLLGVPVGPDEPAEFEPPACTRRCNFAGFSLLPWHRVRELPEEWSTLVRQVWRPAEAAGELDIVEHDGVFIDIGTPADYLAANLHAARLANPEHGNLIAPSASVSGSVSEVVIGGASLVAGRVQRSVVWAGGYVGPDEVLADAIRYGRTGTVSAR